jgi:hypothetical protein
MTGGYQQMHNREKKLKESGRFAACSRNDHQKLSTLFSTAVDNFIVKDYGKLCSYT